MRRIGSIFAALIAVAVGCTAGCTASLTGGTGGTAGTAGSAQSQASPSPAITPLPGPPGQGQPPTTLAGYYAQRLKWTSCESYFECSWLAVPADYAHPGAGHFMLPVVKLPAEDPARRVGALVINPGGPGGSGAQYAISARSGGFSRQVRDRFDIVGFDPRGIGDSRPSVRCMTGPQLDRYYATGGYPIAAAQLPGIAAISKLYASQCQKNDPALLSKIGSANTAKDMDLLRAALGEPKLTYMGKSYGTFLGASYAAQFPGKIRALVLDGAVDPEMSGVRSDSVQSQGFEQGFGQFAAWCAQQRGCPFGSSDAAGAVPKVQALLKKATSSPLSNNTGSGQQANAPMLLEGITAGLYSKQDWPLLKEAIGAAMNGDGSMLVEFANSLMERDASGTYSNLSDVFLSVECIDHPWPKTMSAWVSAANQAAKSAPLFGASGVWGSLPCLYWPAPSQPAVPPAAALKKQSSGAPPILVLGDLHDPATPYSWARALAGDLASGVLLGWNGEGHTSYGMGSTCVDTAVDQYLIGLKAPRDGTVCQ